jgi:hypothetical protein
LYHHNITIPMKNQQYHIFHFWVIVPWKGKKNYFTTFTLFSYNCCFIYG